MKIVLINGSPRAQASASERIISELQQRLGTSFDYALCSAIRDSQSQILTSLKNSDRIVVVFPLYVDGIPSHLLRLLDTIKDQCKDAAPHATVYAICNNGFYDARQNKLALSMIESFCRSTGLPWAQGLGVGAGGMVYTAPAGKGPMTNLGGALDRFAKNILSGYTGENDFVEPNFPRFLYKIAAHSGWKQQAKKNGIRVKDLYHKA